MSVRSDIATRVRLSMDRAYGHLFCDTMPQSVALIYIYHADRII